jgi:hypothetical protein
MHDAKRWQQSANSPSAARGPAPATKATAKRVKAAAR